MYHHGSSDIQNVYACVQQLLLMGCMRARCLVNNSIFETEGRHHF